MEQLPIENPPVWWHQLPLGSVLTSIDKSYGLAEFRFYQNNILVNTYYVDLFTDLIYESFEEWANTISKSYNTISKSYEESLNSIVKLDEFEQDESDTLSISIIDD